jgi:dTDP-4-dehydrorhamnose reductase
MVVATIKAFLKNNSETVVIFGAFGMLGHALQEVFPEAIFQGRDIDITDRARVQSLLLEIKPAIVINAAAYTDVEGCEENREQAFDVNGRAPGYIAEACHASDSLLVHYSTDYVFNGTQKEYRESDNPDPINVYGASKLLGEHLIQIEHDKFLIIRTSWLFGAYGRNFVDTMLSLSLHTEQVRVVNDQFGRPTYTNDLAIETKKLLNREPGIYHVTNSGTCSWYEFARAIIPNAISCSTDEFPQRARRPTYSVLVSSKTAPLRHWREALADYLTTKDRILCK